MDTPAYKAPLDVNEQPIYDALYALRDKLMLLKSDRSNYVKSQDVDVLYKQVIEQVEKLNAVRQDKPDEQNQVDKVLENCLQLVSLFFMTVGRNAEAPAAYSLASTVQRLLDHLREAGFFASQDLFGLGERLAKIEDSVEKGKANHSPALLTRLHARIEACRTRLNECQGLLSHLSPELRVTHTKLVSLLRSLSGLNARTNFDARGLKDLQAKLREIEKELQGAPLEHDDSLSPADAINRYAEKIRSYHENFRTDVPGQEVVRDLLERCFLWSDIVAERQGKLDARFVDTYYDLKGIRDQLEKLSLTQAWSLRETDLYGFQRRLDKIDESRVNGEFVDTEGKPSDLYEQRTLLYLIRKSYSLIYFMMTSSEPVSEALLPIYNQLLTLKKCLREVQRSGGVSSPRELYPYSMKLNSIDNMRQDGKFVINGDIPEGQGSVTALLSECFELAYDLRNDADDNAKDSSANASGDEDDAKEHPADRELRESITSGVKGLSIAQDVN